MKRRTIRYFLSLFSIFLIFQSTTVFAAMPDSLKIGEVLNKQPYADFNAIKSKPVDVVINQGHYATDVATLQSKVNTIVKPMLDQHGISSNIMVKAGTTNIAGTLYAKAQTAITPLSGKAYFWGYSSHLGQYSYTTWEYDASSDSYYQVWKTDTVPMRDSGFWALPIDGTQVLKVLQTGDTYTAKYYDSTTGGCYCYRDTSIPYIYFIMKNGSVLRWAGYEGFVDVTNNTFQYSGRGPYPSIRWGDITDYQHYGYYDYIIKRDGTAYMANYGGSTNSYNWSAPSAGGQFAQIPITGKATKLQMDGYYGCCQTVQILTDQNQTWSIDQSTDYYQQTGVFTVNLTQALSGALDVWMSSQTGALTRLTNGLFNWGGTTFSTPVLGQPAASQQAAGGYYISSWGCSCARDVPSAYNIDSNGNLNVSTFNYGMYGSPSYSTTNLITSNVVAVDWSGDPDYSAYDNRYSSNSYDWVAGVKSDGSIITFKPTGSYAPPSSSIYNFTNVNDMYLKNVQIELQNQVLADDVTSFWQAGHDHYMADLSDIARNELNDGTKLNPILQNLLNNQIKFVGLGNPANQSQYQSLISQNDNQGTYIDNSNLDTTLTNLANYIIQQYDNSSVISQYVLLGDTINYTTHYSDLENDPMYTTRWKYTHDPSVFDNSLGQIPDSGQYRSTPYYSFALPGKYTINFGAQDNPKNDDRFANYRMWSLDSASQMVIYAHRKPIADFTVNFRSKLTNGDYSTDITDVSYDPDHSVSRADKGIVNRIWQWRPITQTWWNSGNPPSELAPNSEYLFYLKVLDPEGAWSDPKVVDVQTYNVNFAPSIVITNPTGTQASPTILNSEPNITWNYTDPENDPQEKWMLDYYYDDNGTLAYHAEGTGNQTNYQTPTGVLSFGRTIRVVGKVYSKNQWSLPSNTVYFYLNQPPTVNITYPSSSDPNNPDFVTQNFTVTWDYSDPEGQPQQAYQVTILDYSSGATLASSGVVTSGTHSWQVNTTLQANKTLYVVAKASDGYTWSAQSAPKFFKIDRPPKAGFAVNPSPPYEGDTVNITSTATDPDGDPLTYQYVITKPDGSSFTSSSANPSFTADQVGTWTAKQTVTDPSGLTDSVTQTFSVLALSVQGQVQHTPEWEQNRQLYNDKTNENRPVSMFWAGEKFILVANTTVMTGSTPTIANAVTVDVPFDFKGESSRIEHVVLNPDSTHTIWTGELWEDDFETIPDGNYLFTFSAYWSNGITKTNTVPIQIQDSIYDYYQIHRRF